MLSNINFKESKARRMTPNFKVSAKARTQDDALTKSFSKSDLFDQGKIDMTSFKDTKKEENMVKKDAFDNTIDKVNENDNFSTFLKEGIDTQNAKRKIDQ